MTESTPGLVERMQSGDLQAFEIPDVSAPVPDRACDHARPVPGRRSCRTSSSRPIEVRARLRTDVSPLPWLQRVCTNLCYSRLSVVEHRSGADRPHRQSRTRPLSPARRGRRVAEIVDVLQQGIDALYKTAIILYYLHGYSTWPRRPARRLPRGHHEVPDPLRAARHSACSSRSPVARHPRPRPSR